jgi:hypothetical protein
VALHAVLFEAVLPLQEIVVKAIGPLPGPVLEAVLERRKGKGGPLQDALVEVFWGEDFLLGDLGRLRFLGRFCISFSNHFM